MKLLRLSIVPIALLCVLLLRLLRGRVRLGSLWTDRIGHLAGNLEVHLCERDAGIRPTCFEIWTAPGVPCSKQLLKMFRRVINIDRTGFTDIVLKVNKLFAGWQSVEIQSGNLDRDINNLWEQYAPHIKFTKKEEARGEAELRRMGIPVDAKWVCLIVRDSAYLPSLSYHSYRDSDIDTYVEAAKALAKRGYYVIRMGAKVIKSMPFTSEHIIDYATNGMRSDLMDIYLPAKCAFMISNGTGLDAIAGIFRRPLCYVNYVPLEYLNTWNQSLAIWKHHWKVDKDHPIFIESHLPHTNYSNYELLNPPRKRMSPKEIFESGSGQFMRAEEYKAAGITLVDNTPEEIRTVAEEMAEALKPYRLPEYSLSDYQSKFWQDFQRSISPYTQAPLHGEIRMSIGREFLKGYQ